MKLKFLSVFCLSLIFVGNSFAGETIRINGTGAGLELMKLIAKVFKKENPGISFDIGKSLGSSAAIKALDANFLDIALSGRPLKPEEMKNGISVAEYGKSPLAIISHKDINVKNVSIKELADLYSGKTAKWPNGEFVRPVLRPLEDMDSKLLEGLSPEMSAALKMARSKSDIQMSITDQDCFGAIKRTPGALSSVALPFTVTDPNAAHVIMLNNIKPTIENVKNNSYPLIKSIYIVQNANASAATMKFRSFLVSDRGRKLAVKSGLLVTLTK